MNGARVDLAQALREVEPTGLWSRLSPVMRRVYLKALRDVTPATASHKGYRLSLERRYRVTDWCGKRLTR